MSGAKPFQAIEGFPISVGTAGNISINGGLVKSAVPVEQTVAIVKDEGGAPVARPASNGIVYMIDGVINPFATYFGVDRAQATQLPQISRQAGTMADVLDSHPALTNLTAVLCVVSPDFLTRLSLFSRPSEASDDETVYLAPSNTAFAHMPAAAMDKARQPGNAHITSYLLSFGLGTFNANQAVLSSISGFNLSVTEVLAGNAAVEDRVCVENGCVWTIGRWLNPLGVV